MDEELLSVFQDEATELIRNIISNFEFYLIDKEQNKITSVLRDLHTLKGSAQFIAHNNLVELIHALESVFKLEVLNTLSDDQTIIVNIQTALNFIVDIVSQIQTKNQLTAPNTLINQLITLSEKYKTQKKKIKQNAHDETHIMVRPSVFKLNLKDIEFISNKIHMLAYSYSEIKDLYEQEKKIIDRIHEMLDKKQNLFQKKIHFKKNNDINSSLGEINTFIEDIKSELEPLSKKIKETCLINTHQHNKLKQLDNKLIQIRLDSFNNYIPRFKNMVAQISKKLNKEVELVIEPTSTEIDKQMFEKLMPAFEHLIRNAIDHGIESPSIRSIHNKTTRGHIFIQLKRKGQQITISLRDDGAGLDISLIKQKAINQGLINPNTDLDESSAIQLLLQPGFTTRHSVSDISGRGIGMDVVNHIVQSLGGRMQILHKSGEFTQIDLIMPANFSQHSSIVFEMNKIFYAVSLPNLVGITRIPMEDSLSEQIVYGNQYYPLINSNQKFSDETASYPSTSHLNVIVVYNDTSSYALLVDKMIGTHNLVIQSIPKIANHSDAFQGAALLPNGDIAYCIEPACFYQYWSSQKAFTT